MTMESSTSKKVKSGAQKRKIKKEQDILLRKLPKLDSFLQKKSDNIHIFNIQSSQSENLNENDVEISINENVQPVVANEDYNRVLLNNENEIDQSCSNNLINDNDLGKYLNKIISDDEKRQIMCTSPCRPKGPFPKDSSNRSFNEHYYYATSKYGSVPRLWLCYSKILNAAYCQPCWLFSNTNDNRQSQWKTGVTDWRHLSHRINSHSSSKFHIQACGVYELWKKNKTVDKSNEEQVRYKASFWKMVLERLFRITLMLSKNCLAFRGHREKISDDYNGNFLSQVNLLANYDDVMKQVLDMPSGSVTYLSPQIQNELISILGEKLLKELTAKINSSLFYALMLDTTQDISKKDQLSIVIRHVHIDRNSNDNAINFNIIETFLGFFHLKDHSATGMTNEVIRILNSLNIPIEKCYGQGYDGASVMSGVYNGVQSKIKEIQPNAEYVHCNSHNLNLVVNDSVVGCHDVMNYYTILQNIYTFFGYSINRWDILSSLSGENEITLKKLNPTRWSGRIQSIAAIKVRFLDIMKALSEIALKSNKADERKEAIIITKKMEKFEFVFITVFLFKIMSKINFVSKKLQQKNIDLSEAASLLEELTVKLKKFRNSFKEFERESEELGKCWKININFTSQRQRQVKRHFDELSSDYRFNNLEERFRVNVFYYTLDKIIVQIEKRFIGMNTINKNFAFLQPKNMLSMSERDITLACDNISKKYPEVFSNQLAIQLIQAASLLKEDLTESMSIKEFANILTKKYSIMESDLPDLYVALLLFFTLPVTVSSVERTFNKLKKIKNYQRNLIGQSRLHHMALLSIEYAEASKMDVKDLINTFAESKARKKNF